VRDAEIIIAAQKVEHYEIAAYGSLRTLAEVLGFSEAAALLQRTLDEEKEADKLLTALSESVNKDAYQEKEEYQEEM
jgi:ferritin-like metal-binding protein YciE